MGKYCAGAQCYDCRLTYVFIFLNGTIQWALNRLCSDNIMFINKIVLE